jgi:hypothetical protein
MECGTSVKCTSSSLLDINIFFFNCRGNYNDTRLFILNSIPKNSCSFGHHVKSLQKALTTLLFMHFFIYRQLLLR